MESLPEKYHNVISKFIDEKGVFPHQMLVLDQNDKLGVFALALDKPNEMMHVVIKTLVKENPKELIYGLDRFTKAGQGTTLGDLVAGCYWNGTGWRPFIIEYQHEPRVVKPIEWNNAHWNENLKKELLDYMKGALKQD